MIGGSTATRPRAGRRGYSGAALSASGEPDPLTCSRPMRTLTPGALGSFRDEAARAAEADSQRPKAGLKHSKPSSDPTQPYSTSAQNPLNLSG